MKRNILRPELARITIDRGGSSTNEFKLPFALLTTKRKRRLRDFNCKMWGNNVGINFVCSIDLLVMGKLEMNIYISHLLLIICV